MLSLFVDENQLNWDRLLPYLMMAYSSSVQASAGFTPYKVLFGQEMVLPVDIMLGVDNMLKFQSVNECDWNSRKFIYSSRSSKNASASSFSATKDMC